MIYRFADALGSDFGDLLLVHGEVRYRVDTWESDLRGNSSSLREVENLVVSMEKSRCEGWLFGARFLLASSNKVAERFLYKGGQSYLIWWYGAEK